MSQPLPKRSMSESAAKRQPQKSNPPVHHMGLTSSMTGLLSSPLSRSTSTRLGNIVLLLLMIVLCYSVCLNKFFTLVRADIVTTYSTRHYGGYDADIVHSMATDSKGNKYVFGNSVFNNNAWGKMYTENYNEVWTPPKNITFIAKVMGNPGKTEWSFSWPQNNYMSIFASKKILVDSDNETIMYIASVIDGSATSFNFFGKYLNNPRNYPQIILACFNTSYPNPNANTAAWDAKVINSPFPLVDIVSMHKKGNSLIIAANVGVPPLNQNQNILMIQQTLSYNSFPAIFTLPELQYILTDPRDMRATGVVLDSKGLIHLSGYVMGNGSVTSGNMTATLGCPIVTTGLKTFKTFVLKFNTSSSTCQLIANTTESQNMTIITSIQNLNDTIYFAGYYQSVNGIALLSGNVLPNYSNGGIFYSRYSSNVLDYVKTIQTDSPSNNVQLAVGGSSKHLGYLVGEFQVPILISKTSTYLNPVYTSSQNNSKFLLKFNGSDGNLEWGTRWNSTLTFTSVSGYPNDYLVSVAGYFFNEDLTFYTAVSSVTVPIFDPASSEGFLLTFCNSDGYTSEVNQCKDYYCGKVLYSNPSVCSSHGSCIAPDTCSCKTGYNGTSCENTYCFNIASNSPMVCSGNGTCVSGDKCTCFANYTGQQCEIPICYGYLANDTKVCSGRGQCVKANTCQCSSSNYTGSDCSSYYCYGTLNTNTSAVCSGHGVCSSPNNCSCDPNYAGSQCEIFYCYGKIGAAGCSNHGKCVGHDTCSCDTGFTGSQCEFNVCWGVSSNSSLVCDSHGTCSSFNNCTCQSGYYGAGCSVKYCYGILSNSSNVCSNSSGTCMDINNCQCFNGYFGQQCELKKCFGILSNDTRVCSGRGTCVNVNQCSCEGDYLTGVECEYTLFTLDYSKGELVTRDPQIVNQNYYQCNSVFSNLTLLGDSKTTTCFTDSALRVFIVKLGGAYLLKPNDTSLQHPQTSRKYFIQEMISSKNLTAVLNVIPERPFFGNSIILRADASQSTLPNRKLDYSFSCSNCPATILNVLSTSQQQPVVTLSGDLFTQGQSYNFIVNVVDQALGISSSALKVVYIYSNQSQINLWDANSLKYYSRMCSNGYDCVLENVLVGHPIIVTLLNSSFTNISHELDGSVLSQMSGKQLYRIPSSFITFNKTSVLKTVVSIPNLGISETFNGYLTFNMDPTMQFYIDGGDKSQFMDKKGSLVLSIKSFDARYSSLISSIQWSCQHVTSGSSCTNILNSTTSSTISFTNNGGMINSGIYRLKCQLQTTFGSNFTLYSTLWMMDNSLRSISSLVYTQPIVPAQGYNNMIILKTILSQTSSSSISNIKLTADFPTKLAFPATTSTFKDQPDGSTLIQTTIDASTYLYENILYTFTVNVTLTSGHIFSSLYFTKIMPRMNKFSGCNIYPSSGIAFDTLFTLSCSNIGSEADYSSLKMILFDSSQKQMTLSSSKRNVMVTRLPILSDSAFVKFILEDNYGGSVTYQVAVKTNLPPDLASVISVFPPNYYATYVFDYLDKALKKNIGYDVTLKQYIDIASALSIFLNSPSVDASKAFADINDNVSKMIDYLMTYLDLFENLSFNADDQLVEVLSPLVSKIVLFINKVGQLSTLNASDRNSLIQTMKFILSVNPNVSSELSNAIALLSSSLTSPSSSSSSQNMTQFSSNILQVIQLKLGLIDLKTAQDGVMDLNGMTLSLTYGLKLTSFSNMKIVLNSQFGIQLPSTLQFVDTNAVASDYKFVATVLNVTNSQFSIGKNKTRMIVSGGVMTVQVNRLQDGTSLQISNLQNPILLDFLNLAISSDNLVLYQSNKANLTCRYLQESTGDWLEDGVTTLVTINSDNTISVKCQTTHLTTFSVFLDTASTSSSNGGNTNAVASSNTKPLANGGGDLAVAIAVPVSIVSLMIILLVIVTVVIVTLVIRRKKMQKQKGLSFNEKNKSNENHYNMSINNTNTATHDPMLRNSQKNSVSGLSDIEMQEDTGTSSLFISDYRSVREQLMSTGGHGDIVPISVSQSAGMTSSKSNRSNSSTSSGRTDVINRKYEILEKIGAGGFGSVFKARNLFYTGKPGEIEFFAIKKVQLSGMSELNEKFKEAVNMFRCRHDNIVYLEDAVVDENTMSLYLIMKFYGNGDLDYFIKKRKRLSEKMMLQVILQVCRGLDYLQKTMSMIHRDIKPSNIFIDEIDEANERIKIVLSDFGLAKESNVLNSFSFAGTPFFMSSELIVGGKYSFNTDIFSLGCSIFVMITFDMSLSLGQLLLKHQTNLQEAKDYIIRKILETDTVYSQQFIDLLWRMVDFDPEKRPNAGDIVESLSKDEYFKQVLSL
nr:unnamed protein product [Naegleria fowleri]